MARGSVNIFEQHVEKAALGLGAVFLLIMVYLYLVSSPNRVDYGGKRVAPTGLADAIRADAEALDQAMKNAPAVSSDVPDYSTKLAEQHSAGIFMAKAQGEPLVPAELPLAGDFGQPIPTLSEQQEEGQSDIVLVPPLPPSAPVLRPGRNLVVAERPSSEKEGEAETAAGEAVELPWVSVAAYFDKAAQQNAMTKAGYATYLSAVYVAGVDLQRQELLPDGRYTDWQDVRGRAMPQLDIPVPEFDPINGAIVNRDAITHTFAEVKARQQQICQPAFYKTQAGEEWKMPALDGYPDAESANPKVKTVKNPPKVEPEPGGKPPKIETGQATGKAGEKADQDAKKTEQNMKEADKDIKEAEDAYRKGHDDEAARLAKKVLDNEAARRAAHNRAHAILQSVELLRKQPGKKGSGHPGGHGTHEEQPVKPEPGSPPPPPPGKPREGTPEKPKEPTLISHPKDPEKVAVWGHDDTVQSGKTYRYRMRVKLWNRYVAKLAALRNPEQGKQCVLLGDWSLPSEPVTVTPAAYFFVTSAPPGKDTVTVTVYKWHRGARIKQTFNVGIGDLIGQSQEAETGVLDRQTLQPTRETVDYSTGALVLDLRFDQPVVQRSVSDKGKGEFTLRDSESAVLVYLDPADAQVKQRVERFDHYDPTLRALRESEE